jgi:hypothetical protein
VKENLNLEDLTEIRKHTDGIAQFLKNRLSSTLQTLQPLLAPQRVLGRHAGGKEDPASSNKALAELKENYATVRGSPFALLQELDEDWIKEIGTRIELYPWEYIHEAQSDEGIKQITITCPVRWVLNYRSGYSLSELRQALGSPGARHEHVRQFVTNALVMDLVFAHTPGLAELLHALRYEVKVEQIPDLGSLRLMTISACIPSFRPPDDLILPAIGLSGVPAFNELIDTEAIESLTDPLRISIEKLLN